MPPATSGPAAGQGQCVCGPDERARRVLMVRRLHPAVTMQMLLQTFGVFGSVTGCKVFTHKSGRSAGCASLEFASHQAACAALRGLQGIVLHGKHVMLQWFDQSMTTVASPVGRGPGQRAELAGGSSILSEGGLGARALSSAAGAAGPVRNNTASCPGLSPFGMFAAAGAHTGPQHPFGNNAAAMAAAAAAAAAVAAQQQQQQQLQHPNDAAAALLSSQHHQLPPLVVQQLQRQVSAPLGAFGQLSPTGAHIPPSPLTPGSHGGGWEALLSPVGHNNNNNNSHQHPGGGQQPFAPGHHRQQQQRESATSSRGGAGGCGEQQHQQQGQQQAGWGAAGHSSAALAAAAAAAAKLSAAMATGSASQDNINMAASLQHLANMQQQALAYAAWQNHQQQAAAAMLQHHLSGQLLGGCAAQQAQMHLLGARSMPSELGHSLSTELLLQQATANLQCQQHQQQQGPGGSRGSRDGPRPSAAEAAGNLSRQHSTPAMAAGGAHLLSACDGAGAASNSSGGGADSIPAAAAGHSQVDQGASGGPLRVKSPGAGRRRSTGALASMCSDGLLGPSSTSTSGMMKPSGPEGPMKKHLHWDQRQQHAGDQAAGSNGDNAALGGGGSGAEGGRSSGRSSSHLLLSSLRGYSGSDDTANTSPDVNALASALAATRQQQQQHDHATATAAAAAAAAVSSCYLSSPTWLASQRHGGLNAAHQLSQHELIASLQGSGGSQGMQRSPSAAAAMQTQQQQQSFMLAAAAAAAGAGGSPGAGGYGSAQQQQRLGSGSLQGSQQGPRGASRVIDSSGKAVRGGFASQQSSSQSRLCASAGSRPSSAVSAGLDAMSVAAATAAAAAAKGWQQQHEAGRDAEEAPASSEAFKHKHRMQLQLPADGRTAAPSSLAGGPGAGGLDQQLITTEVLPDSPSAAQQQQQSYQQLHPAHSPFDGEPQLQASSSSTAGAAAAAGGGGSDGSSAWTNWSASMAALLSPAHVSSLASRRFEDLITLQHGLGQQQLQEAGSGGGDGSSEGSSQQPPWQLQQQQGPGGSTDMFGAPRADGSGSAAGSLPLGKTRHNSLCLDSRPGLLTLSHMFQVQEHVAQHQVSARPSPRGSRGSSPQPQSQQQQYNAPYGSFTFQPPVLRGFGQLGGSSSNLGGGGSSSSFVGSSSSSNPICQPFQLPDFFSRDSSRVHCQSPRGSVSTPGGGGAAAAAAAGSRAQNRDAQQQPRQQQQQRVGPHPLHAASGMQHQLSENLNGLRIPEGYATTALDAADRTPGSPIAACSSSSARNLQHSYSMPARFSAPGGAGDALAAAAAAAVAANESSGGGGAVGDSQQQQVFRNIWGPSSGGC